MSGDGWVSLGQCITRLEHVFNIHNRIQTSESRWRQQQMVTQATHFAEGVTCMTEKLLQNSDSVDIDASVITGFAVG